MRTAFFSFTPGPTGRAYSTPPAPLAVGRGLAQALLPLSENLNPSPLSALPVSDFSFSDLVSHSRLARLLPPQSLSTDWNDASVHDPTGRTGTGKIVDS